ncbi:TIGR03915 family putative DNA repair protein [Pseudochryseolinea flava]|uniref:DNA metabolism protein n=1 Tax=Pseudochryseolinea flava TaxID=2059302 RepID=A0A364XW95_9BACT|nr:TIGR03915 family putative DNA repair protein [Pseudochryseolinea flava]RAV98461.1 DNA metabolism protein [Pseudochryseolinea flava]
MTTLLYDGSFNGLLTAIFIAFEYKMYDCSIDTKERYQATMFDSPETVMTDKLKAQRVWEGLCKKVSNHARREFYYAFLSGLPGIEDTLLAYVRYAFQNNSTIEKNFANSVVNMVSQTAHSVHREKHRMEAFVRFIRLQDDLYCAFISPDFNVLPLVASHFQDRYADQHWLIYDRDRDYGIHHDPQTRLVSDVIIEKSTADTSLSTTVHEEEVAYQTLWRSYFDHVNIQERRNIKLHLRHVPKRYWADLTEKTAGV